MLKRIVISLVFLLCWNVSALAEEWELLRVDGNVRMSVDGKTWSRVKSGTQLASGTWIRTGARGRAIIGRGTERIVYRSNTLAALSVSQPTGQRTQVTHQRGSVFLSMNTTKRKSTSVITPHLAAVIKGTVLEVTTDQNSASVRVDKGLVEVQSNGQSVDVGPGQEASSNGRSVEVAAASVTSSVPGAPNTFSLDLSPAPASPASAQSGAASQAAANGAAAGRSSASQGLGNSNGNSNGNGNGNSGGNGNGNSGGNGNGNSGGNGNGNSGGNGNGNSGGNGNGNGGGGESEGNSGGNGNGNGGGGESEGNSGGNGNGNSGGGESEGNSGGESEGNSGGNGNGNGGGNGNGNSNGNGNENR